MMGTVVAIEVHGESRAHCYDALSKAFAELHRLDRLMSVFKPESDIAAINRNAGRNCVRVDQSLIEVVEQARTYHAITLGAFDITIEPLMRAWGFREQKLKVRPSDSELTRLHEAIGFHQIELDKVNSTIGLKHPLAALDVGGIAVGYAVDRVVRLLRSEGVQAAFINHSGDVYALGTPEEADGWPVAIPYPTDPTRTATTLSMRDCALSTSSLYEKYVELRGERFGHIVDPHSGLATQAIRSVSVIAPTAVAADALSTGSFLLTGESLKRVIHQTAGIRLIAIDREGVTYF